MTKNAEPVDLVGPFYEVADRLDQLVEAGKAAAWSDTEWTRHIKTVLADLGNANGYSVFCSGCEGNTGGEWLFDLCWLHYNNDALADMPLALECEWTANQVDDDFQKLVVARGRLKVMIFTVPRKASVVDGIGSLLRHVSTYAHTSVGDKYLLSGWDNDDQTFKHHSFEVKEVQR